MAYLEFPVGRLLILWDQMLLLASIFGPRQDERHTPFAWLVPCGVKSSCTLRTLSRVLRLWLVLSGRICTSEPLASLLAALLLVRCEFLNILSANRQFINAFLPSLCVSPLSSFRYVISSRPLYIFRINTKKAARAPYESDLVLLHVSLSTFLGTLLGTLKKFRFFFYDQICLPFLSVRHPINSSRKSCTGLGREEVNTGQFNGLR